MFGMAVKLKINMKIWEWGDCAMRQSKNITDWFYVLIYSGFNKCVHSFSFY
jgi:hypothetical protein